MTSIKVIDHGYAGFTMEEKRCQIWGKVMENNLRVWKLQNGTNYAWYLIPERNNIEPFLTREVKESFQRDNLEIVPPVEADSLRTVMARQVDHQVMHFDNSEIMRAIHEQNEGLRLEDVKKIHTKSGMWLVKLRFESQRMAEHVKEHGILILNQSVPYFMIEKEIYVKTKACLNCFSFEHNRWNCTEPKQFKCTRCAMQGHKRNTCKTNPIKCINCGQDHETFFPQCPVRQEYMKRKAEEERKKERAKVNPLNTYANVAKTTVINQEDTENCPKMTQKLMSTIISGIAFAKMCDNEAPGSFQQIIDEFYDLNELPKVKFPNRSRINSIFQSCGVNKEQMPGFNNTNTSTPSHHTSKPTANINGNGINTPGCSNHVNGNNVEVPMSTQQQSNPQDPINMPPPIATQEATKRGREDLDSSTEEEKTPVIHQETGARGRAQDKKPQDPRIRKKSRSLSTGGVKINLKKMELAIFYPNTWDNVDNNNVAKIKLVDKMLQEEAPFSHKTIITSAKLKEVLHEEIINETLDVNEIKFCQIEENRFNNLVKQHKEVNKGYNNKLSWRN